MRKFAALVCLLLVGSFALAAPPDYPYRANLIPWDVGGVTPALGSAAHPWGKSYIDTLYTLLLGTADTARRADSLRYGASYYAADFPANLWADSLAVKLPLHGLADSATLAKLALNSDSLGGIAPTSYLRSDELDRFVVSAALGSGAVGLDVQVTGIVSPMDYWYAFAATALTGGNGVGIKGTGTSIGVYGDGGASGWSGYFPGRMFADTATHDMVYVVDATGADTTWIYNTADSAIVNSDNPIRIGRSGKTVSMHKALLDTLILSLLNVDATHDSVLTVVSGEVQMAGTNTLDVDKVDGTHGDSLYTWTQTPAVAQTQAIKIYHPKNGYTSGNVSPTSAPMAQLPITLASSGHYVIHMMGVHQNSPATAWEGVMSLYIVGGVVVNPSFNVSIGNPEVQGKVHLGYDASNFICILVGVASGMSSPKLMITKVEALGAVSTDFTNSSITYSLTTDAAFVLAGGTWIKVFAPYSHNFGNRSAIYDYDEAHASYGAAGWCGFTAGDSCIVEDTLGMAFGQYATATYKRSVIFNLWEATTKATTTAGQFKVAAPGGFWTEYAHVDTAASLKYRTSGGLSSGIVAWTASRQAISVPGLTATCVGVAIPDSTAGVALDGKALSCWAKTDSLIVYDAAAVKATPGGSFNYKIEWK